MYRRLEENDLPASQVWQVIFSIQWSPKINRDFLLLKTQMPWEWNKASFPHLNALSKPNECELLSLQMTLGKIDIFGGVKSTIKMIH